MAGSRNRAKPHFQRSAGHYGAQVLDVSVFRLEATDSDGSRWIFPIGRTKM
jgi:hypothetical protein